jgi:hypothetical protein
MEEKIDYLADSKEKSGCQTQTNSQQTVDEASTNRPSVDVAYNKSGLPYRLILAYMRTITALVSGTFSAISWYSIDPILEPELRHKVSTSQQTKHKPN